jgi:hypothetical protein
MPVFTSLYNFGTQLFPFGIQPDSEATAISTPDPPSDSLHDQQVHLLTAPPRIRISSTSTNTHSKTSYLDVDTNQSNANTISKHKSNSKHSKPPSTSFEEREKDPIKEAAEEKKKEVEDALGESVDDDDPEAEPDVSKENGYIVTTSCPNKPEPKPTEVPPLSKGCINRNGRRRRCLR